MYMNGVVAQQHMHIHQMVSFRQAMLVWVDNDLMHTFVLAERMY